MTAADGERPSVAVGISGQEDDPPLVGKKNDDKKIVGKENSVSGQGKAKDGFSRVPTNESPSLPTNKSAVPTNRIEREIKRGWIEWAAHNTKKYGKRRYPRHREWEWNGEKWVKSSPVYNSRPDLKIMNEADYVKYAERRDRAKKLGY